METWATSSVDLHLSVDRTLGVRAGLEQALRESVRSGRLHVGTRLPSSRALAADLGVARNTVADVYGQLIAEGYLSGRVGSGTVVAPRDFAGQVVAVEPAAAPVRDRSAGEVGRGPAYGLRAGTPDLSLFPRAAWSAAVRRALATAPNEVFGYSDPRGRPELRAALATYLTRARGLQCDPERIVVCGGHVQAVGLLVRALVARGGSRFALERPGLPYLPELVRRRGMTVVPLGVDASGARTDRLARTRASAVMLTPAHQFPTGALLSPARRAAVLDWSRSSGGVVVEDDYDGEFRFDRQPVGALQGLAPERVVYIGTASKSLAPGLRLGWTVLPPDLVAPVAAEKELDDKHAPVLDQLALADLIGSGAYDRQVRRARLVYRRRRQHLVEALAERVPQVQVSGAAAGLQALVRLPADVDEAEVERRAEAAGLAVEGVGRYGADAAWGPALVVGYGAPSERGFGAALDLLCRVLAASVQVPH